jgi:LCP family protein required for cell wall assembly
VAGGRLNIMLMGGDAGPDRTGVRPDSLSLVSIDLTTGKPVVIGLPRNLENVPFPKGTEMHKLWPQGFDCGNACLLNAIWTWASNNTADFPGVANPGLTATEQAVTGITGLKVNYYVMVDLASFEDLVNALGGITLRNDVVVPIGGETSPVTGQMNPGLLHLDGYHALWYARSRSNSSDYARMARQKCVEEAMLTQLNPQKVITAFRQLAGAAASYTQTDIPASQLSMLASVAEQARSQPLHKVDLIPPAVPPGNPNWTTVRAMVNAAVASTRATPAATAAAGAKAAKKGSHPGSSAAASSSAPNSSNTASTVDGQVVCSVPR